MRKLLLSALACVAFAGSSFASNEVVKNEDFYLNDKFDTDESKDNSSIVYKFTCNVSIYYTDFFGNEQVYTETKYFYFVTPLEGGGMCNSHANTVAQRFKTLSPN